MEKSSRIKRMLIALLSCITAICLMCGCLTAFAAEDGAKVKNIIKNGDFEGTLKLDPTGVDGWFGGQTKTENTESDQAQTGAKSMKVNVVNKNGFTRYRMSDKDFDLASGITYRISASMKAETDDAQVQFSTQFTYGNSRITNEKGEVVKPAEWHSLVNTDALEFSTLSKTEWTTVSYTMYLKYDTATKDLEWAFNGGEKTINKNVESNVFGTKCIFSGMDVIFTAKTPCTFYVDNVLVVPDGEVLPEPEPEVPTLTKSVLTVKDEAGAVIKDATVIGLDGASGKEVVNKGDGTYELTGLKEKCAAAIVCKGYQVEKVALDAEAKEVTLKKLAAAPSAAGNLVPNGNFEEGDAKAWDSMYKTNVTSNTDLYVKNGNKAMLVTIPADARPLDRPSLRLPYEQLNFTDGVTYTISLDAMGITGNTSFKIFAFLISQDNSSGAPKYNYIPRNTEYPSFSLNNYEWKHASVTLCVKHDGKNATFSVNGAPEKIVENVPNIVAFDFIILPQTKDCVFAVDNVSMMASYNAKISVLGKDGAPSETAEVTAKDANGTAIAASQIKFDEASGKYIISGLTGEVTVSVKDGDTVYPDQKVNADKSEITISAPFTVTITLKDEDGNAVSGATVKVRGGNKFKDNGDGTYTLEGVTSAIKVTILKEGYRFQYNDELNFENNEITVTGKKNVAPPPVKPDPEKPDPEKPEPETPEEPEKKGGCGGSIVATSAIAATVVLGAAAVAMKKRQH